LDATNAHETGDAHASHAGGHVVEGRVLVGVWAALVVLTVVTVAVTKVDLGAMNLWVALGIAVAKAILVSLYFMHLRYDHPINGIVFAGTLLFLAIFIGLAMADSLHYRPDLAPELQERLVR
jgi:cytochrome c oxidase subunit 4